MLDQSTIRNRLLAYLAPQDFALLVPILELVELDRDFVLATPNKPIAHVYFIESGMVSVVAEKADGRSIEVGVYGRDGMGPTTVLLGSDRTPHHQYMQIGGSGFRVKTVDFLRIVDQSLTLRTMMLRSVHVFMTRTGSIRARKWQFRCRRTLGALGVDVPRPARRNGVSDHPRLPFDDARRAPFERNGCHPSA